MPCRAFISLCLVAVSVVVVVGVSVVSDTVAVGVGPLFAVEREGIEGNGFGPPGGGPMHR